MSRRSKSNNDTKEILRDRLLIAIAYAIRQIPFEYNSRVQSNLNEALKDFQEKVNSE